MSKPLLKLLTDFADQEGLDVTIKSSIHPRSTELNPRRIFTVKFYTNEMEWTCGEQEVAISSSEKFEPAAKRSIVNTKRVIRHWRNENDKELD